MAAKKKKYPTAVKTSTTSIVKNNSSRQVRDWSVYQKAIFDNVQNGTGHTVVIAVAGSGKTTSLCEALHYVPAKCKTLLVAFNKKIAEELKLRAPSSIETMTLHSLGFRIIRNTWGNVQLDNNKCFNLVKDLLNNKFINNDTLYSICKTISLCKGFLIDTPDKIDDIIDKFSIECGDVERSEFINYVIQSLRKCKEQKNIIDFDDMIWFPIVFGLIKPAYDRIFVDEFQDLNPSQIAMVLMSCKKDGRILGLGDPKQALYAFRGADANAIENFKNKTNALSLPLSFTYRCPKKVVKMAQKISPQIIAPDSAKEGIVEYISESDLLKKVRVGDFILSRTNAPLIKYCMDFIKNKIPANIQGRDVGSNLIALINKSKKKSVDKLLDWVEEWRDKETSRLVKKHRSTTEITDKAECLITLCSEASSLNEVKQNIDKLFNDVDDSSKIILSTVHRCKGLERNRVFILKGTFRFGFNDDENNIWYVAITRAIEELYIVSKNPTTESLKEVSKKEEVIKVETPTIPSIDFEDEDLEQVLEDTDDSWNSADWND